MIEIAVCGKYLSALLECDGADQHGGAGNPAIRPLLLIWAASSSSGALRKTPANGRKPVRILRDALLRGYPKAALAEWRPTFERVFRAPVRIGQGRTVAVVTPNPMPAPRSQGLDRSIHQ